MHNDSQFIQTLEICLSQTATSIISAPDMPIVHTTPTHITAVIDTLKTHPSLMFISFIDICGVDYPQREQRFEIVYHLLSPKYNRRIRIKITTNAYSSVPSIVSIFKGADWFEREVYDLYGVQFIGHPDLRRILTDYDFTGHPLRKDFPLTGFVEVRWNEDEGRIIHESVQLPQEFRNFDSLSPWEGPPHETKT